MCGEILLFENILLKYVLVDTCHLNLIITFNKTYPLIYQFTLIKQITTPLTAMSRYWHK